MKKNLRKGISSMLVILMLGMCFPVNAEAIEPRIDFTETDLNNWVNGLLNYKDGEDLDYGESISYSTTWFMGLSTQELLARLIYAENTYTGQATDRTAIAWVILNRCNSTKSYFFNTNPDTKKTGTSADAKLWNVATKSGQFATITSNSSSETSDAREPDIEKPAWEEATRLACLLCLTINKSYFRQFASNPLGITTQEYFLSYSTAFSGFSEDENGRLCFNGDPIHLVTLLNPRIEITADNYEYYRDNRITGYDQHNVFFGYDE